MKIFVIKNGGPPLLGRNGIKELNISVDKLLNINHIDKIDSTQVSKILQYKYHKVFENKLGKFKVSKATLYLKENSIPVFCKARSLPLAILQF